MKAKQKAGLHEDKSSRAGQNAISELPSRPFNFRDIIIVLVMAWAARLAFMIFVPAGARCFDAFSWETEAKLLAAGENPYHANQLLNWPPFWMQCIFVISKVAAVLNVPFFRVLQVFLILVETGVMILLFRLIQEVVPTAPVRNMVIIGLALNPIAVFLICQHCNFDVIVALWLLLFMISLLRYNRTDNLGDWLCACLFLGLGILTKTVPLILIPMLAGGFRRATASFRFLGFFLLLAPITVGMSIIYVLAPADVTNNVIAYRSFEPDSDVYYGIPALFHLAGVYKFVGIQHIFFYGLLALGMILSWILFWRRQSIGSRETVLYAALVLVAIPNLGPGYGTQYIYWFMPFLVATYAFFNNQWRVLLVGFGLISACTYVIEYGLYPEYGYNLLYIMAHAATSAELNTVLHTNPSDQVESLLQVIQKWGSQRGHILVHLPIFIAYLALLAFGARILLRNIPNLRVTRFQTGCFSLVMTTLLALAIGVSYIGSDAHVVEALKSRAEKGNAQAQLQLAKKYLTGKGVEADPTNAFQWFLKAAGQGVAEAQYQVGELYLTGEGTDKDSDAGIPWLRKAADQGNADAQYNLGLLYENGVSVKQDPAEAANWYQRAAEQGHVLAEYKLGLIYINLRRDYAGAAQWFLKAAQQGNAPAQNSLGVLYIQGLGVNQDANEALKWFQQSADQGFAIAQNNCGMLYFSGQRYDESAQWYHKAADRGYAVAQYNLAQLYQKGLGYPQNPGEAVLWYSSAANQGYGPAQFALGKIYQEGQGVKADRLEAYKFFRLAQLQGVSDAETELTNCAATMSQAQINAVEDEVKQLQKQNEK